MEIYNREKLLNHYKNIYMQNRESLSEGGVGDEYLVTPEIDTRMSIALVIRINKQVAKEIKKYLREISKIEPNLYFYPEEDLHITVLDILKGVPNRMIPENIEAYIQCVKECAKKVKAFHIEFNETTASDNALLICGYYEYELEKLRELLRESLSRNNLQLEERYKTFSAHITVARIPKKLDCPTQFVELCKLNTAFGVLLVDTIELVYHNWYDSTKTTLARFKLNQ